ncbi:MAG: hypothetical protein IKL68_00860 [Clostridia bacterium]|nr:hypothetical protein [Clostridia bacterium]
MSKINFKAYTDISVIIEMMPESLRNKLSSEFIYFININKDKDYVSSINPKIPLNKQTVSKETKELMAIIYREYFCSPAKKEELLDEDDEILRSEERSKIGFDPRSIFIKQEETVNDEEINALTVKEDEGYITKIINKIKKLFKK